MKAVSGYKSLIDEVGKMVYIFASFQDYRFKDLAKEQGWTLDYIINIQGKVQASILPEQIKEELIGDGKEAEFKGRLRTAFFELNGSPIFAPSYFPEFDEDCFELPTKDNPDRNRDVLDALAVVYGDKAFEIMARLGSICQHTNLIVQDVYNILDEVCKFVGYTPEQQEQAEEATNTDSLAVEQPEPRQTAGGQKEKPKRGRPTEPFASKMINDADGEKLKKMHTILNGKRGRDFALMIWACIKRGWCNKPTYTQVKEEFGDIGSGTGYNRYLNNNTMFTEEEKNGALNSLD